jgi:hypothetical protein
MIFDVDHEHIWCKDLHLASDVNQTRLWLPSLVRIAAAAANSSGTSVFLVVISKSDASLESNSAVVTDPHSPGRSPGGSPAGSGVNSIDFYSLKLVEIFTNAYANPQSPALVSSSVADAKLGMAAVEVQLVQVQQRLASLSRFRHTLPVTDPQEPRLRREIKVVKEQLADLQHAQSLLHRDCAAAILAGESSKTLVEVALEARCAMNIEFNMTIGSGCAAPALADLHLSAAVWPESVRQLLSHQGVCVYNSDKAVAVSADGHVAAHCQGNALHIRSRSIAPERQQTIDMPNSIVALALNPAGNVTAAAVTSLTGGRYVFCVYIATALHHQQVMNVDWKCDSRAVVYTYSVKIVPVFGA